MIIRLHPIEPTLISSEASILEAIQVLDKSAMQIAVATDSAGRLAGVVTDGDIRRAILRKISIDAPISSILNGDPVTARADASLVELRELMNSQTRVLRVPAVDENGVVVGLFMIEDVVSDNTGNTPIVIMAGGMGTRLRPHTETVPKPMVHLGEKPILERIIDVTRNQGYRSYYISVRYLSEKIIDHFGDGSDWGISIQYVQERERLGTAGALRLIADKLDEPFLVMNGDLVTNMDFNSLRHFHRETDSIATMCVREHDMQIPYGVVDQENGRLRQLREKPVLKNFVNAGIYMLDPFTLKYVTPSGFFDITTLFETLIEQHSDATSIFPIREYWRDIGTPEDLRRVSEEIKEYYI
ncbi:nucleotidyltransferase family protein [Roseibium denhamense]|uniref:CBS domain-containing protein n=2 Tax=Roseibium denhamense TaxID=76305 RepID=A0ABY1PQF1_9HYPH|nr:nucleotidyltransferase family protein [Roseibium denhamense]SMP37149.1 CBS domain-containing protein [Roseibium denhamense]